MIGVELKHHPRKIMSVVPEQTRLCEKVCTKVFKSESIVITLGNVGFAVAESWRQGNGQQAVAPKHPIVCISEIDGIVCVVYMAEQQCGINLYDVFGQFLFAECDSLVIVSESCLKRAATFTLDSVLSERCWPRVMVVVEYVGEVDTGAPRLQTMETGVETFEVLPCDACNPGGFTRVERVVFRKKTACVEHE